MDLLEYRNDLGKTWISNKQELSNEVYVKGDAMKLYREATYPKTKYYKYSGEKRCPKKGEHYLSGAQPAVYQAPNDLSMVFHIMIEAPTPPQTIEKDGLIYRLQA